MRPADARAFLRSRAQVTFHQTFESEPGGSDRDTRTVIMARTTANPFGQPSLEDLMVRFLAARSDAASAAVEPSEGEVEPHEVAAGFRVDPRAAWTDATIGNTTAPVQ